MNAPQGIARRWSNLSKWWQALAIVQTGVALGSAILLLAGPDTLGPLLTLLSSGCGLMFLLQRASKPARAPSEPFALKAVLDLNQKRHDSP